MTCLKSSSVNASLENEPIVVSASLAARLATTGMAKPKNFSTFCWISLPIASRLSASRQWLKKSGSRADQVQTFSHRPWPPLRPRTAPIKKQLRKITRWLMVSATARGVKIQRAFLKYLRQRRLQRVAYEAGVPACRRVTMAQERPNPNRVSESRCRF